MKRFRIGNKVSGHDFGVYEAETGADALDMMARDAGYKSYADACDAFAEIEAGLLVTEVEGDG